MPEKNFDFEKARRTPCRFPRNIHLLHLIPLILLSLVLLFAFLWFESASVRDLYLENARRSLQARCLFLLPFLENAMQRDGVKSLQELERRVARGEIEDGRFTVVDSSGNVIFDTSASPEAMENHIDRPEIAEALRAFERGERFCTLIRYSSTLERRMLYTSTLFRIDGENYILRGALSIRRIDGMVARIRQEILVSVAVSVLIAGLFTAFIFVGVTLPTRALKSAARKIAGGDLDVRLPIPRYGSIRSLAIYLNVMVEELKARISQIQREKSERDAIFSALAEAVVMLDNEGKVIDSNAAAKQIFDWPENTDPRGISFQGLVRSAEMNRFVSSLRESGKSDETELTLDFPSGGERHLRVSGRKISWGGGRFAGLLLVIYDMTRLRKLENYRRDFIANLSHEIKTPLTAIRGSVETLLDGALQRPDDAERFLRMAALHSERLTSLVQDILSLSQLECREADVAKDFTLFPAADAVRTAVSLCRSKAEECSVDLTLSGADSPALVLGDRPLLEQAVLNLIDNAVKYSGSAGKRVDVSLESSGGQVRITVKDYGCGIAPEHQERLFERFYRVDKARSRKLGGTGLGLAIVKHIMQLHGGTVSLQSEPGKGSIFSLILPEHPESGK